MTSILQHHGKALEALSAPAILMDAQYRILATNSAYRQAFHQGHDVAGDYCYRASHNYDRPCDQAGECCPLQACISTRIPQQMLHIHPVASSHEYVDVDIRPLCDDQGNTLYYQEVLRNTLIASAEPCTTGLVGASPAFIRMLEEVHRVAHAAVPVLLLGESGTGKELIARALHDISDRADKPFVVVECSGLSEMLFESELFGHRKGAFTGALAEKEGLVEVVRGGTLFLDEIGDVPLALQVKLLRLLESRTYRKVGDTVTRQAQFRLVCATHQSLQHMMAEGRFRQDLYYRISAFPIQLPPLRQRREDIGLLAHSILLRIAPERKLTLSQEACDLLSRHDFPGNIRELVNLLERARIMAQGTQLQTVHFPELRGPPATMLHQNVSAPLPVPSDLELLTLKEQEQRYLSYWVEHYPGTQAQLAEQLGISLRTLTRKISALRPGERVKVKRL